MVATTTSKTSTITAVTILEMTTTVITMAGMVVAMNLVTRMTTMLHHVRGEEVVPNEGDVVAVSARS
jgi:hypothetical protein